MFRITHLAGLSGIVLLAGCSLNLSSLVGDSDPQAYAVGDNLYAVETASAILKQGGNATDAATAMYFALAATDPAAAGLGGGGVCLVHNPANDSNTEYSFLPGNSGGTFATPAAVKGFAAMQYRYGQMRWQKVVSPGEALAHTGFKMTKALHKALRANLDKIRLDATLAQEFLDENGAVKPVGTLLKAPDLAQSLTELRLHGAQSLYTGALAKKLSGYSQIPAAKLAAYRSLEGAPEKRDLNGMIVYLPQGKSGAGSYVRILLSKTAAAEHKSAFVAALKQLKSGTPANGGATGFAVMDQNGMSVSCTITMNTPFGAARTVPGTGITLAPAKASHAYLAPVIAADSNGSTAALTASAAGGPSANAMVVSTLLRISHDEDIYDRKQLDSFGGSDTDLANQIACDSDGCVAMADPKGTGYGQTIHLPKVK